MFIVNSRAAEVIQFPRNHSLILLTFLFFLLLYLLSLNICSLSLSLSLSIYLPPTLRNYLLLLLISSFSPLFPSLFNLLPVSFHSPLSFIPLLLLSLNPF